MLNATALAFAVDVLAVHVIELKSRGRAERARRRAVSASARTALLMAGAGARRHLRLLGSVASAGKPAQHPALAAHRIRLRVRQLPHANVTFLRHAPACDGPRRAHRSACTCSPTGPGHAGFERAVEEHARPLMWPRGPYSGAARRRAAARERVPRARPPAVPPEWLRLPLPQAAGAARALPDVDHLIVLDPDTVVLADIALLWAQFSQFGPGHLLHGRRPERPLLPPAARPGGRGVLGGLGGRAAQPRRQRRRHPAARGGGAQRGNRVPELVARSVTHHAHAARRRTRPPHELAEQDTLNYAAARRARRGRSS